MYCKLNTGIAKELLEKKVFKHRYIKSRVMLVDYFYTYNGATNTLRELSYSLRLNSSTVGSALLLLMEKDIITCVGTKNTGRNGPNPKIYALNRDKLDDLLATK